MEKELSILFRHGSDILTSEGMLSEKNFPHHADITCYEHSISVAIISIRLAMKFCHDMDMRSLVRGALLHDYYLYNWHSRDKWHRHHGFVHARFALENAERDFVLDDVQRDIISRHMFPLNIRPPKYKQSVIVTLADKICAGRELAASTLPFLGFKACVGI